MNETALLYNFLAVGGVLFALGLVGFLVRRNMIVMFLCAEMMLQGVSVSLVGFGRYHNDWGGQMLVVFIITVAACEAGLAMALILMLAQRAGKLDSTTWQDLREEGLPEDAYGWYLDLRRYGTFVHSGFGIGLERTVAWICGLPHLREAIAFPRMMHRLKP